MTTPTREQVIAAFIADFEPMGYQIDLAKCRCCTFASESTQDAFMGFTAGRDQGLREAKEVCEVQQSIQPNEPRAVVAACCAAAIEQLRGK